MRIGLLCICLAVWLPGNTAEAAEFTCAGGDVECLKQAIHTSNGNSEANTIRLGAGTYTLTAADHAGFGGDTGLPAIAGSVAIVGAGASATIIERDVPPHAGLHFRLFEVTETGRLDLEHLTLAGGGGDLSNWGGAVYSLGTLRIRNAIVRDNFAGAGGAIWAPSADVSVSDSHFVANADMVFGMMVIGCDPLSSTPCPPSTAGATATITRSSFYRNIDPAVIRVVSGATDIRDSDFVDNTGDHNAAILVEGQDPVTIANTSVIGHHGNLVRAILGTGNADVLVTNSTIVHNTLGVGGVRIQNSIVWGNDRLVDPTGDCVGVGTGTALPVTSLGHNVFGNSTWCGAVPSDLVGDPGFDLMGVSFVTCPYGTYCDAPFLDTGRPGGRYLRLLPDSRAIDAGNAAACPATDQQGLERPVDGAGTGVRACDIGAVEFYPPVDDRVQLERWRSHFVRPSRLEFVDPHASAGAFRFTATFRNDGPDDICQVAFVVRALDGPTGTNPVLLTDTGELLGGLHTAISAAQAGAQPHLASGRRGRYQFTVGVQQRATVDFQVAMIGDATSGPCGPGRERDDQAIRRQP
jgi:hypothetical protein